ncbi:hypothetical protein Sme01_66330 [Sphaerisporangium melleum]|uniref:Secreted protein n=1 Tax=Sphaerisporangium melleum TaxID=321316 RepID=A0A917VQH2_9ACTN|nr:hypothetical protein [Sphaerisporangium melleum]GGL04236.1 hypothetical protein GCM10007964_52930 [Sphaerisporangium melleum]GII74157.1 hypothetical protein Sme01_66330 [Sphaerisporangium melleum]
MGILLRGTAAAVVFLVTTGPAAAQATAPAGRWSVVHDDRRDSYEAVTVTPGGAVWVAGTRRPAGGSTGAEPLLLKGGRSTFTRVTGPGFAVKRLASASDTRVWAFGASRYARWDGKHWQVKRWSHGRVDRAYAIGKNLWVIEDSSTFPPAGKAGWKARSTLRLLTGSVWRKVRTPIVVKGLDGKWAAGSVRGTAALARWTGTAWRAVALPALPAAHAGQISELTDVAVDGETGRVMAVGWAAWPCGDAKRSFCGETLLLSGYLGGFTFEVRGEPGFQPRAQAEPDGRGGAFVVYDAKGGGSAFLHIGTDGVEPGVFPAPPGRQASVRDLAIQPESGSVWAAGGARSGRGGVIWSYRR